MVFIGVELEGVEIAGATDGIDIQGDVPTVNGPFNADLPVRRREEGGPGDGCGNTIVPCRCEPPESLGREEFARLSIVPSVLQRSKLLKEVRNILPGRLNIKGVVDFL